MKIIIAGAGEVGQHLARILADDRHDVTVIDVDSQNLKQLSSHLDILTIQGSALTISVLNEAGVAQCDLFIAVAHFPEMNIASAVIAKQLGAPHTIARVRDPELLLEKNVELYRRMGIDSLIYPQALAAQEIATFVERAATRESFDFADGLLSLFVLKVEDTASVVGKYMQEIIPNQEELQKYRVIAIKRGFSTIIPKGDDICQPNDILYVVSNRQGVNKMLETFEKKDLAVSQVMILGGSRTGRATAKILQKQFDVKLIEIDPIKARKLSEQLENTIVINGDGRSMDLLVEEGIRNTDVFIATTSNAETNILSCYLAKRVGVKRAIAEVENVDYIGLASDMGIDTLINKKTIAANSIHKFTMSNSADISSTRHLTQCDAQVLEIIVHENVKITKSTLMEMKDFPKDAVIGGVVRGKNAFIPSGKTQICSGDKVLVFALPSAVNGVKNLFEK
ncbi:MAG: Trk system potassium transporter TrkA [Bacteroidales bacterium]|nr:Trk system potassium transporter TrkA [Bacteroidales bacterium]